MIPYEVGDVVTIISEIPEHVPDSSATWVPEMEGYLGQSMTIVDVTGNEQCTYYRMEEDNRRWSWSRDMFEEDNPVEDITFEVASEIELMRLIS